MMARKHKVTEMATIIITNTALPVDGFPFTSFTSTSKEIMFDNGSELVTLNIGSDSAWSAANVKVLAGVINSDAALNYDIYVIEELSASIISIVNISNVI